MEDCGHAPQHKDMVKIDFSTPCSVYFIGIGGISMSGLAEVLADRGFAVSGSDRAPSPVTENLERRGIQINYGQRAENITGAIDLVVYTAAIHPDNPEYAESVRLSIPMMSRADLLGEIMAMYPDSVAISGTHGKTTTTSMISEILLAAGKDPTLSIGGMLNSIGGNIRIGRSGLFVTEACEYTNSFLSLTPKTALILDIDADHLDFFKDLADIRRSFRIFAEKIPADGTLIISSDIDNLEEITGSLPCRIVTFGSDPAKSDYFASDITYNSGACGSFTLNSPDRSTRISLAVPGAHNILNALAAAAAADVLGIAREDTARGLLAFGGTHRRFEYRGEFNGVTVIDDYAHHPTEIRATLTAASKLDHGRLFCAFQSHTYSRTAALLDDFAKALSLADMVLVAPIYAARETDTLGMSAELLAEKINAAGGHAAAFPDFVSIENFVKENCAKNDLLITMGAGNIDTIAKDLAG